MGVRSIFGFIPTDVVFARIIPCSGWKLSNSDRVMASPPTLVASSLALADKLIVKRKETDHALHPQE